jgi:hypothetical protein
MDRNEPPTTERPPSLRETIGCASFAALIVSGFVFRSTVGDKEAWLWAVSSALIGVGSQAAILWLALPSQYQLAGSGLLFGLVVLAGVLGGGRASGGIAYLAALEVFGIAALAIVRRMDFPWHRIGRCILAIICGGGAVVLLAGPFAFGAVFAFGWGGVTWPLVVVLVLFVLAIGVGCVAGLWMLEGNVTEPSSPARWATAGGGFAAGVATSFLAAIPFNSSAGAEYAVPDYAGIVFFLLACLSVAAGTIAGYSLRAGRLLARPMPPESHGTTR